MCFCIKRYWYCIIMYIVLALLMHIICIKNNFLPRLLQYIDIFVIAKYILQKDKKKVFFYPFYKLPSYVKLFFI